MGNIFAKEPVAIAGVFSIILNLALSFGLKLSIEQVSMINALVVAVLALLVRNSVTAPANLKP